jgi:hypothetical protein
MASSGARAAGTRDVARDEDRARGRTPAQWYAYLVGATLLLVGIIGFFADSGFDTGNNVQGDELLGIFEVNAWHNLVHIASGLLLLAAAPKRASAKAITLIFGIAYGAVTIYGLIDGSDVLGLFPVNPADNVLHIALSAVAILAAMASDADDRELRTSTSKTAYGTGDADEERFGRDVDPLTGRDRDDATITRRTTRH